MKRRHIGIILVVLVVVGAIAAFALMWRPEIAALADGKQPPLDRVLVAHGYQLAELGNCENCHTGEGGEPYAGGLAMPTPFGTINSTNITPDHEAGIGTWSEQAFERAMRKGIDRQGGHLYPAFPYNHFTYSSNEDIRSLYAFLRSVPAVRNEIAANGLTFPFNVRALIAGWNLLFLDTDRLEPVAEQSDEWNRGRYLAEGVAHCGACHTPRNLMGAEKASQQYQGAVIDGWYAPPLSGADAGNWTEAQLGNYLASGFSRHHGAAAGPMAETALNLAQATAADVQAMAVYFASLNEGEKQSMQAIDKHNVDASAEGHELWVGACAQCHDGSAGAVGPSNALSLSVSATIRQANSTNVVRTIVGGIEAYRDNGGPYMPAFGDILTDDEIAKIVRYVRSRYADGAQWTELEDEIDKARSDAAGEG